MRSEHPQDQSRPHEGKPKYEPPHIVAYDADELLERIGPAVACARWSDAAGAREGEDGSWDDEDE